MKDTKGRIRKKLKKFKPQWWLRNGHVQSMLGQLRQVKRYARRREKLTLPDGDRITLHWTSRRCGPIVVVLPGTECGADEAHTLGLLNATHKMGGRGVVLPFRGMTDELQRVRGYHGADSEDLAFLIEHLRAREPDTPIFAVGCSLGGSALLHHLAETGSKSGLVATSVVSVPFHIKRVVKKVSGLLGGFYNRRILWSAKRRYIKNYARIDNPPVSIEEAEAIQTLMEFEARVNAPLCGFEDIEAFYHHTDSRRCLPLVKTPTLLIHAEDDPFNADRVNLEELELSRMIQREIQPYGGHLGFMDRTEEGRWVSWLDDRVTAWFDKHLHELKYV